MSTESETNGGRRVGELATATGLTVRTLHYYEEIGLLDPPERTPAGHRLYSADDVERLYRVSVLRGLGLPLGEIKKALDDPSWQLRSALDAHLVDIDARLKHVSRLRGRLTTLISTLERAADSHTDNLISIIEEMNKMTTAVERRISILVYSDIESAYDYLIRVFALTPGELTRTDDGEVVHGELHAGDGVVWLHPETDEFRLASPSTLGAATASMAVMVDDVDDHYRHAVGEGADIVYPPVDQPYGYREYSARDCEGALWSFMKEETQASLGVQE